MATTRRNFLAGTAAATAIPSWALATSVGSDPRVQEIFVKRLGGPDKYVRTGPLRSIDGGKTWFAWCPCMAEGRPLCDEWNVTHEHPLVSDEQKTKIDERVARFADKRAAQVTLRGEVGRPLTHDELDENFRLLRQMIKRGSLA